MRPASQVQLHSMQIVRLCAFVPTPRVTFVCTLQVLVAEGHLAPAGP